MKKIRTAFIFTVTLTSFLTIPLSWIVSFITDALVEATSSTCNFSGGGGSRNLCYWDKVSTSFLFAFFIALIIVFFARKHFKVGQAKDFFIGTAYLILAPLLNVFIYSKLTQSLNLWGNELGKFNDTFYIPLALLVNLMFFCIILFSAQRPLKSK